MSILVQLIFLTTTANLVLAAPIDDFCGKTKSPPRCVALLKGTDERAATAAPELLEYIAIEAGQTTAGNARIQVATLAKGASDPVAKVDYRSCESSYLDALDELNFGNENLQKHRYGKLVQTSQIVKRVAYGCHAAIHKAPGLLKVANDDTVLLGDVIGIIAMAL